MKSTRLLGWVALSSLLVASPAASADGASPPVVTQTTEHAAHAPAALPALPGLVAHYAASQIAGLVDSDRVAQWDDGSGNGWHATQPVLSDRPYYRTARLNGLPVLEFDGHPGGSGSDETQGPWLLTPNHGTLSTQTWSIWVVGRVRDNGDVTGCCPAIYAETRDITDITSLVSLEDHGTRFKWAGGGSAAGQPSLEPSKFYTVAAARNGSDVRVYRNGAEDGSGVANRETQTVAQTSIGVLRRNDQQDNLNGELAEMVIVNRAVTPEERAQVDEYLRQKYQHYSPPPPPVGGRNLKISTGSVDLQWDGGTGQTAYYLLRYNTASGVANLIPIGGTLTSFSDATVVSGTMYCYVLAAMNGATFLGLSDLTCAMTGASTGTVLPQGFALTLNQSATATLTWSPPAGGVGSYLLQVIPLDGSPVSSVLLSNGATATSQSVSGSGTCFQLVAFRLVEFGTTDVLCGVPGVSTLNHVPAGTTPASTHESFAEVQRRLTGTNVSAFLPTG